MDTGRVHPHLIRRGDRVAANGNRPRSSPPVDTPTIYCSFVQTLGSVGMTIVSGVVAALIALGFDGWRSDRARRKEGRHALQEMQRVLADLSAVLLALDGVIDETPLETLSWGDVALARRSAYPYRDLLAPSDRELVAKSTIPYEAHSDLPYDNRQLVVNDWAMELDDAIERAFAGRLKRLQLRLQGHVPSRRDN